MVELVDALSPVLEQALVVVLGAAVAAISSAARRYIVAKHLESTVSAAMAMVKVADPGVAAQPLGEDAAAAVASWLTAHGHAVSAASARRLIAAVARQAQQDAASAPKPAA